MILAQTPDGEITEKHTGRLERQIEETPQYWLWTHKRWKRKMQESDKPLLQATESNATKFFKVTNSNMKSGKKESVSA
mgnify:CR=1 FL=1